MSKVASLQSLPTRRERWLSQLVTDGTVSTPALVFDSSEIDRILGLFEHYIPQAKIFYAVKANNASVCLRYLAGRGINFDVASAQEIADLREVGVAPSRMILSNPVKSPATVNAVFDQGVKFVSVDNPYDIKALGDAARRSPTKEPLNVIVRIRIPTTDVQIDLNNKFGCFEHEALELLKLASANGFVARGIQFHVGTQSWNVHNFQIGIESSLRIMEQARVTLGTSCDTVNIGGGFPDELLARDAGGYNTFFSELAKTLRPAIDRGYNIIAEPGRILVSSACSAVCSVIGKSIRNGTPWLYLDDGAYGLFSGKFFDHKEFHFRVLRQAAVAGADRFIAYTVAGPTCDSIDIVSQPTMLPPNLELGDILCCHNMGAYSITTACRFNGFGKYDVYLGNMDSESSSETSRAKLKRREGRAQNE